MEAEDQFDFKKLLVWEKSVLFAKEVITTVEENTSDRNHYRLLEQIESSVTSIAMNIAEGKGRYSKKEFIHFLYISRGSLFETITLLNIFASMNWIASEQVNLLENKAIELSKMLNGLIKSIKNSQ